MSEPSLSIHVCGQPKCEHDRDGPEVIDCYDGTRVFDRAKVKEHGGAFVVSSSCSRCGSTAFEIDMWAEDSAPATSREETEK